MAGKPMLIAVDTGNHSIKTPNTVFRACYTEYAWFMKGRVTVYVTRNSHMRIIKQILITCFW